MASVCAAHPQDMGTIAGGLFALKQAMDAGDVSGLSSVASDTTTAISNIQSDAVGATSSNLPAMRTFLEDLQTLSNTFNNPPTYPTAYAGDRQVAQIQGDASRVGCDFGSSSATTTTTATATASASANPQAQAACTAIKADIPTLGSVNGFGQYGKDLLRLMPVANPSDQTTVITAVGHIETVLKDISAGSFKQQDANAVNADAYKIGQICGGYLSNG
jgi:hypothetical protein